MTPKYAIYFIPEFEDRKKISKLRSEMCKLCHTTQALQYPVHMSLAYGTELKDYALFEKEIRDFCKKTKSFTLHAEPNISMLPDRFWMGIHIDHSSQLLHCKNTIESIKNKYSTQSSTMDFLPHITLAFPAKVDDLDPVKNPVLRFHFNRIAIVKKEQEGKPYRIHKYIKLAQP